MPAGAAITPRAFPPRREGIRRLPQYEIHRVFLEGRHLDPRACDHVIDRAARQRAIVFVRPYAEQHMALFGIGMAAVDQGLDHRHHRADIFGRARLMAWPQCAQGVHIGMIPGDRLIGDVADRAAGLGGLGVDLVIHVGEVAHIGHMRRPIDMPQQAEQRVEHHHGPGVADMGAVIDGRAADIHAHVFGVQGSELLLLPGLGIVQPDRHLSSPQKAHATARGAGRSHLFQEG